MKIKSSTLLLALLFSISAAPQTASHFDGQTWWNHVKVLAEPVKIGQIGIPEALGIKLISRRGKPCLYIGENT